jgi:hypothetical protein
MKSECIVKDVLPLNRELKIRLLKAIEKGEINLNDFPEFTALITPPIKQITGMVIL